jgi:hypothetical protein
MKIARLCRSILAASVTIALVPAMSHGQEMQESKQQFRVSIPSRMIVSAPTKMLTTSKIGSDGNQVFAGQRYTVSANSIRGANVSFSADRAFTNTVDPLLKRDVRLDLAIASSDGPASWALQILRDQTNYAAGDEVATVKAASQRPGNAAFELTITVIMDSDSHLAEGDYEMNIAVSLTAN